MALENLRHQDQNVYGLAMLPVISVAVTWVSPVFDVLEAASRNVGLLLE